MLYRCEEWQINGIWYCQHTASFPKDVLMWVVPSRILNISPADFLKLLLETYQPDRFYHNEDCSFCYWGWSDQSKMRKYKNWINAEARKVNFQI